MMTLLSVTKKDGYQILRIRSLLTNTRGSRVHCHAGTSSKGINIIAASLTTIKCVYLDSQLLLWSPINMLHLVRRQITIYRRLFPWFVSLHCYISLSIFPLLSLYIAMLTQNTSHLFDNVTWHASHSILKKILNLLFYLLFYSFRIFVNCSILYFNCIVSHFFPLTFVNLS